MTGSNRRDFIVGIFVIFGVLLLMAFFIARPASGVTTPIPPAMKAAAATLSAKIDTTARLHPIVTPIFPMTKQWRTVYILPIPSNVISLKLDLNCNTAVPLAVWKDPNFIATIGSDGTTFPINLWQIDAKSVITLLGVTRLPMLSAKQPTCFSQLLVYPSSLWPTLVPGATLMVEWNPALANQYDPVIQFGLPYASYRYPNSKDVDTRALLGPYQFAK